jgi:hypothetical protein
MWLKYKLDRLCNEIRFPEPYGWRQAHADQEQVKQFADKQPATPRERNRLFQSNVRIAVWERSVEFKERRELRRLRIRHKAKDEFNAAETAEYQRLQKAYPNEEFEPHDPSEDRAAERIKYLATLERDADYR